ncbi:hypothetical protein, partial [Aeromonas rivipollensis]|uniref:hypothetical protein n=1 Tax=Aeromonas rivipollensis TaxID=948519 RepID=UPI003D230818
AACQGIRRVPSGGIGECRTSKLNSRFTDGRKLAAGARGRRCFVDYLLHKDNRYLAVVEAKKESEHPTKGLQQAIDYAKKLLVRFVYSSNGRVRA